VKFNLAVLPGDGVGPELAVEGIKILQVIAKKFGHEFNYKYGLIGGAAIDEQGTALAPETLKMCKAADAVFLVSVGGPKWDDPNAKTRPEDGLLAARKGLKLFANLRPVFLYPELVDATNFKPEVVRGVDFIVVRELTGGLYFGKPKKRWTTTTGRHGVDSMVYSEHEIERIVRVGFELARSRKKKLVSVDKANVLESSRLWRQVASEVARNYPDVAMENMLIDTCSMRFIQNPRYFDVLVMENTFGDIITDEASTLAGSMGMLPSASLAGVPEEGKRIFGMYEPIHGSAPSHTGKNDINPIATINSIAMMLRYSLSLPVEAKAIETAVEQTLKDGFRTYDIMSEGCTKLGTREMGDQIAKRI
jgi:3-isopropylmalate dehydrogenase